MNTRDLGISSPHVTTTHHLPELFASLLAEMAAEELKTPGVGHCPDSTGEGGLWGVVGPGWSSSAS